MSISIKVTMEYPEIGSLDCNHCTGDKRRGGVWGGGGSYMSISIKLAIEKPGSVSCSRRSKYPSTNPVC